MTIRASLFLALVVILTAHIGRLEAAPSPEVSNFTLENGLEVVVIPDRRSSIATHMIWYKVGSADEPAGKSGLAHFLEHLFFRGPEDGPAAHFSGVVSMLGGEENAFTSNDYTAYFQRIGRDHLETVMTLEAERMSGLTLTDDDIRIERDIIMEEYKMRVATSPTARLVEQINAQLYRDHPYGTPVIGWPRDISALDREDVLAFYRRFYVPNNAVLVIVGDVTPEEIRTLAEKTYGKLKPRTQLELRIRQRGPQTFEPGKLVLTDTRAQPSLRRSYPVPSYAVAAAGVAEALDVLAHILGGGSASRLYRALVAEAPLATWASGAYEGAALGTSRFDLQASVEPGVTFAEIDSVFDRVIADIVREGVTAEELERAKVRMIANVAYAQDSQEMRARSFGVALTTGATIADIRSWPRRIQAVTPEAVRDAARVWLNDGSSVTGYLTNEVRIISEKQE
jgi:zinc protease